MPHKENELTVKQENFCNYYVETGNKSEAYRRAFSCGNMKDTTINVKACQMLTKAKIAVRIRELQAEIKEKSDITKEQVLEEARAVMEARITDYLSFDGKDITFKPFSELTERNIKAIKGIKIGNKGVELEIHDKKWSIERLCKMLGYDAPVKNALTDEEGKSLIGAIEVMIVSTPEEVKKEEGNAGKDY